MRALDFMRYAKLSLIIISTNTPSFIKGRATILTNIIGF